MADSNPRPVIAVFDFDGTITYADSFLPFLRHLGGFFWFWFGMLLLSPALLLHALGRMENWRAKEKFLGHFLQGRTSDSLDGTSADFVKRRLPLLINPAAMEKVRWHQEQGHRLLLLSASPELYLRHWAKENGFEKVLGTRLAENDGRLTGRIEGRNCHGEEKLVRLQLEVGELDRHEIYSYGDSRSDKVLLNAIDHGEYRSFEGGSKVGYKVAGLWRFLRALM